MFRDKSVSWALLVAIAVLLTTTSAQRGPLAAQKKASPRAKSPVTEVTPVLEPRAMDLLKAACSRLAEAHSMSFTAVVSYESPSRLGPPLIYTTTSDVTLQRPDKLRVITSGDGPASEFYYDGKMMLAFTPSDNLVAVAEAPPTIDAALKAAYDSAAIYFPFTDLIVTDPYGSLAQGLTHAFYIGQSRIVGGTTTDMIAYVNDVVFVQIWIGAEDNLPRRMRAVYRDDPSRLRHQLDLSDWQLDAALSAEAFASSRALNATRIEFARPDPQLPPGAKPKAKGKPSKIRGKASTIP